MKKIIIALPILIGGHCSAYATAMDLSCPCNDGTTVKTGEYCPGSTVPCGSTDPSGPVITFKCPSTCPNTTWTVDFTQKYWARCNDNKQCEFECMAGYYGTPTGMLTVDGSIAECQPCPSRGKSARGSTKITDCYITGGSDTTGTYTYTSNCYYTE